MNDKIKLLAEQAGCAWWEGRGLRDMTQCQHELEKFAELIIRECAECAEVNDYSLAAGRTGGKAIKEYFGIE